MEIFKESLRSSLDVVQELSLEVISTCKSNVSEIHWGDVKIFLQRIFLGTALSIIICTNQIEIPDLDKSRPPERTDTRSQPLTLLASHILQFGPPREADVSLPRSLTNSLSE